MNRLSIIETMVESNFQDENISMRKIVNYITKNNVFFGICEESEDLEYLKKYYEYKPD